MKGFDNMKNLKLKKWVKYLMVIILMIIIILILSHLFFRLSAKQEEFAQKCDQKKGNLCNYYEVQKYIKQGDYNE